MYEVESNVPMPSGSLYKLVNELSVGQSFEFPSERSNTVRSYASRIKDTSGKVYKIMSIDDVSSRVWRVE